MSKYILLLFFIINISISRMLQDTNYTNITDSSNKTIISDTSNTTIISDSPIITNNNTDSTNVSNLSNNSDKRLVEKDVFISQYKSTLSKSQREEYELWIQHKETFNIKENEVVNMFKSYAPEDQDYFAKVYRLAWPFYSLALLCLVLQLMYFFTKYCCKWHRGPKKLGLYYICMTYCLIGKDY
jgi:hypothetical protein